MSELENEQKNKREKEKYWKREKYGKKTCETGGIESLNAHGNGELLEYIKWSVPFDAFT